MSEPVAAPPFVEQSIAGWGNLPVERCRVYRPHRLRELSEILDHGDGGGLVPRGLGRSYGDAALNAGGGVVLSERLDRILSFDESCGLLECEAGVSIGDIVDVFLPRGWFVPVTPGTRFVTIGGAIAADVHGKNHHRDSSIGFFIEDFTLRTATGDTLTCSRSRNVEAFRATLGGMGLTGFIVSARLRLLPVETAWMTVDTLRVRNLDAALESLEEGDREHRYSVAWIDCLAGGSALGRSVLLRGDHAAAADLPAHLRARPLHAPPRRARAVRRFAPSWLLSPMTVRVFNGLYYARHGSGSALVPYGPFFYPLDSLGQWNRLYGRRGFVQYQLMFPPQTSRRGLVAVLEEVSAARAASFLAVLKRFGPASEGMLSFPAPGHTLSLDLPNRGSALRSLIERLDRIVLEHGGRVYLAKDAMLGREAFDAMYPGAAAFRAVRRTLDPEGRLSSSLGRRLALA